MTSLEPTWPRARQFKLDGEITTFLGKTGWLVLPLIAEVPFVSSAGDLP